MFHPFTHINLNASQKRIQNGLVPMGFGEYTLEFFFACIDVGFLHELFNFIRELIINLLEG